MSFTGIKQGLYFFLEFPRESLTLAFSSLLRLPTLLGSCPFFHHQRLPAHFALNTAKKVSPFTGLHGLGFTGSSVGEKKIHLQCRRHKRCEFNPWFGKYPWRRKWQPIPYSCLRNSVERGGWWAVVCGLTKELDTTE